MDGAGELKKAPACGAKCASSGRARGNWWTCPELNWQSLFAGEARDPSHKPKLNWRRAEGSNPYPFEHPGIRSRLPSTTAAPSVLTEGR